MIVFSAACGKYEVATKQNSSVGEIKSTTAQSLSGAEQTLLSQMCVSLSSKTTTLSSAIGSVFKFGTTVTDCSGDVASSGDVETYITGSGGTYSFKRRSDNSDFFFPNVETSSSGLLSEICSNLGNATNGFSSGQEITFFKARDILSTDCAPVTGEVCLYIEKGTSQGNDTVKIHTKEWIRVRTSSNQGKIGFFTFRKKVSQSYCGQNQVLIQTATLK